MIPDIIINNAAFCSKNARMCIDRLAHYKKLIGPLRFEVTEMDDLLTVAFLAGNPELELSGFVADYLNVTPELLFRVEADNKILQLLRDEKEIQLSGGLYHELQIRMTYNSNHIEGSKLSEAQTM